MDASETNKLVKGAFLLTLAGLISKVLSAGYRNPLQNLTGDLGFYIYQQVYPILGMVTVLALYGFPSAISKMTAELKTEGKNLSFQRFYIPVFFILFGMGCGLFLLLYMNSSTIASWIGDANLTKTYQLAAFSFLLIPFSALLRGIFQGNDDMKPTAYSQISEQLVRVVVIITAAVVLAMTGGNVYTIGQAGALAAILGTVAATCVLGIFFIKRSPVSSDSYPIPWSYYVKTLLIVGVVAALNHMVLLIIQFADIFTLLPGLVEHGLSARHAMEAKGIFDRGQPLIQLGTVLGSSFALALIPSLSGRKLVAEPATVHQYIRSALSFSIYLAVGATIGLILIFPEANALLFKNDDGTASLRILVLAILLSSLAITGSSILQGLGYMKRTAGFIIGAFVIKWIANMVLVPLWGITGSAIATVVSLLLLACVVFVEMNRKLPQLQFFRHIRWRALIVASAGMTLYILLIDYVVSFMHLTSRLEIFVYVLFVTVSGAFVYILLLLRWKAFSEKELSMLPFAGFFIRLQKGRN